MTSPETLNFEELLAPVPGTSPVGKSLDEDTSPVSLWSKLKMARDQARQAERRQRDGDPDADPPKWHDIVGLSGKVLTEQSKDLRVATWLLDAQFREHGYPGLRDGLRLIRELCSKFWDEIYPLPDRDDGTGRRILQLAGFLDSTDLPVRLRLVPFTSEAGGRAMSLVDLEECARLERLDPEAMQRRLDAGAVTKDAFEQSVRATSTKTLQSTVDDIQACRAELNQLASLLDPKDLRDGTGHRVSLPTSAISEKLEDCERTIKGLFKDRPPVQPAGSPTPDGSGNGQISTRYSTSDGLIEASSVETREAAFRALLGVADFFKRTEPHSPVSYALEQAVRWGKMPLPDLLSELISDDKVRGEMFRRVGIAQPNPPEVN